MTLRTTHSTKTVQDFVDLWKSRRLNLSPAFQRKSVWSTGDRRLLVNSLLDGIPLPSIYLYRQVGKGGQPVYDVIDGKQRLESTLLYLSRGPLAKDEARLEVRRAVADGDVEDWWSWADLPKAERHRFLTTALPVIEIEGELAEIIELFVRINSTGAKLTPQERRNAHFFTSPVLKAAQKAADGLSENLQNNGVLSSSQIKRMKHVELTTELMLGISAGVPLNKKSKIDDIIRGDSLDSKELAVLGHEVGGIR